MADFRHRIFLQCLGHPLGMVLIETRVIVHKAFVFRFCCRIDVEGSTVERVFLLFVLRPHPRIC